MNIVLVEEHAGAGKEYSFNKDVIRFGRDASECDVAFDGASVSDGFAKTRRNRVSKWCLGRR